MEANRITAESPVTVLPGVGSVRAAAYAKLGIRTLGELLRHYPRAYENRGTVRLLSETVPDAKNAVVLTVASEARVVRLRSHKSFLKFRAFDESGSCEIVYFNQDFLKSKFQIGSTFRFFGKTERQGTRYSMSSPAAEPWLPGGYLPPLVAVYRRTDGISAAQVTRDVAAALELLGGEEDYLPAELREKRALCTLSYAERNIHCPDSAEALATARRRLVYDEFFCFSLGAALSGARARRGEAPACPNGDVAPLTSLLPYRLTEAQRRVVEEIRQDLQSTTPMRRMLVGDVGCGKTVCAAAAMLIAVQNGRQAALMVPTEILARQHYAELSPLFSAMGYACGLLIGATPAAEKRRIKKALAAPEAAGRLPIVIGTHALLSEDVQFAAPGLVVTDEQHRFGAAQRALLSEKNHYAHLLVMSATPIPRSLALILYGDLEISRIDGMPPGRQRVSTYVVDESYRARLDGFIRRQVGDGGQVYIVCPAVEGGEEMDAGELTLAQICSGDEKLMQEPKAAPSMKAAVNYAEELTKIFPELSVAFLHGKMKSAEKDDVMRRFTAGEVQILVSTTVIEVGVNVPNACLMIVENAERFGLSQLHQLRGRVGRGTRKSYCILVTGDEGGTASHAKERLEVLRTTYDGYRIAEEDLAQRGPGDFLACEAGGAVRQSGALAFRLADAGEDVGLMKEATEDARALIRSDPELQTAPLLSARIAELFAPESGYIS